MTMIHRLCPWCGCKLEPKILQIEDKIRVICSKCGWKIKEVTRKLAEPKEEPKPEILEVKPEQIPEAKPKPIWPLIVGGIILIILIILFVKFVLL
jgi:uncharacterized membrane protein YvbJ